VQPGDQLDKVARVSNFGEDWAYLRVQMDFTFKHEESGAPIAFDFAAPASDDKDDILMWAALTGLRGFNLNDAQTINPNLKYNDLDGYFYYVDTAEPTKDGAQKLKEFGTGNALNGFNDVGTIDDQLTILNGFNIPKYIFVNFDYLNSVFNYPAQVAKAAAAQPAIDLYQQILADSATWDETDAGLRDVVGFDYNYVGTYGPEFADLQDWADGLTNLWYGMPASVTDIQNHFAELPALIAAAQAAVAAPASQPDLWPSTPWIIATDTPDVNGPYWNGTVINGKISGKMATGWVEVSNKLADLWLGIDNHAEDVQVDNNQYTDLWTNYTAGDNFVNYPYWEAAFNFQNWNDPNFVPFNDPTITAEPTDLTGDGDSGFAILPDDPANP